MPKFSQKSIFLSFIILASLGLIISGCLKKPPVNTNQLINQNQNTSTATTTEEIDTSNWKTYRNEEYGVSFSYPIKSDRFPAEPPHEVVPKNDGILIANSIFIRMFQIGNYDPITYIKNVVLEDADKNCVLKIFQDSEELPEGYLGYFINIIDSAGVERAIIIADDVDCTKYSGVGQPAYFIYNEDVTNKILHIVIYQDPSMSGSQINKFIKSIRIFN